MSYALVDWSDREKAEADCRRESEYHPEDFAAYRMLNDLYTQDRKWTEAKANLQAWAKADPADPHPYTSLGSLAMMQGQYKDAESHLKHALALSTEPDPIRLLLGRSQIQAGDTEAGKTTLHELMDKSNDAGMLNDAAYELGDAGLDLAADEAASQRSVAMVEQRSNAVKLEQAGKEDFRNTMSLAADWDTLGWILFKENKLPQAESCRRGRRQRCSARAWSRARRDHRPACWCCWRRARRCAKSSHHEERMSPCACPKPSPQSAA